MKNALGKHTKFSSDKTELEERSIRYYLQSLARELLPNDRIRICLRHRLPGKERVEIWYAEEKKRARYGGLMRCANLWICPICSVSIAERRRAELADALNNNRDKYLRLLITYTARHEKRMGLRDTLLSLTSAYKYYRAGRFGSFLHDEMGQVGAIRATEITYGLNGWHPHFHELAFFDWNAIGRDMEPYMQAESMRTHCAQRWVDSLRREGLSGISSIAYDVTHGGKKVDEYVAKYGKLPLEKGWGQSGEMTRQQSKRASRDGKTAFELLWDYGEGDYRSGILFREYAEATRGRKQLFWSPGLKEMLGICESTDDVAASEELPCDVLLASLDIDDWRLIIRTGNRAVLLNIASSGDADAVWRFIGGLREDNGDLGGIELEDDK